MTIEQAELLYDYQDRFERDPSSVANAYKLFRELNKHGMYLTVIRLYYRHDLDKASTIDQYYEHMNSQFEYAKDHIEQLRVTSGLDGQTGGFGDSSENN